MLPHVRTIVRSLLLAGTRMLRVFTRGGGRDRLVALKRPVADAGEGWALWLVVIFIALCALLAVPGAVE